MVYLCIMKQGKNGNIMAYKIGTLFYICLNMHCYLLYLTVT